METASNFTTVFEHLKALMVSLEEQCVVLHNQQGKYYLALNPIPNVKRDLWFGGVEIKKNHVSYHLMAVYEHPELLLNASDALKKRMQGKSCFNFKKVDEALFAELGELTQRGFVEFARHIQQTYQTE